MSPCDRLEYNQKECEVDSASHGERLPIARPTIQTHSRRVKTTIRISTHQQASTSAVEPAIFPLTHDDLTGDIERIITKAVSPYVDESNPLLHLEELKAECRFKLARIIHDGRLLSRMVVSWWA